MGACSSHKSATAPGGAAEGPNYAKVLADQHGGPMPVRFPEAMATWPAVYGSRCEGRTALITGGTSGLGLYLAQLLAQLGFAVLLPARPGFEAEAAAAVRTIAEAVPGARLVVPEVGLELGSFESVREFAAAVRKTHTTIDVLCCNAGRGGSSKCARETTKDGMESIMQINLFSHFLLCAELLPLLKASPASRIIFQTSCARLTPGAIIRKKLGDLNGADEKAFDAFSQYQLSKAGLCLFMRALNQRLLDAGVDNVIACAVDPGLSATGINAQHNLGHSMFCMPDGCISTRCLHQRFGQHAADGALPAAVACVGEHVQRGDWYTPKRGTTGEPVKGDPRWHLQAKFDPLNKRSLFPADAPDALWKQMVKFTAAEWDV